MRTNIFYSWQSDLENKYNRFFIQDCLKKAIKELSKDTDIHVEWNLDRDTKGEFGTVDIVETIFKKINESHIFIGDISLINEGCKKKTPNPNVLVELGYAATKVGWENVITIFNEAHGKVEELPFDLRFRRPIIYKLDANTDKEKVAQIRKNLIRVIKETILKANPEYVLHMRKLGLEFSQESKEALRLAIDRPYLWEDKLMREILRPHIEKIEKAEFEFQKGLYLKEIRIMNMEDFMNWVTRFISSTADMIHVISKIQRFEIPNLYILDDETEDPVRIKRCISRMCSVYHKAIILQEELLSIQSPEITSNLKEYLFKQMEILISPFKKFFYDLTKVINQNGEHIKKQPTTYSWREEIIQNNEMIEKELMKLSEITLTKSTRKILLQRIEKIKNNLQ